MSLQREYNQLQSIAYAALLLLITAALVTGVTFALYLAYHYPGQLLIFVVLVILEFVTTPAKENTR